MEADQAKFMWVKIDLQIDETLRRGGYITNAQGGNLWVTFKYERLQILGYVKIYIMMPIMV